MICVFCKGKLVKKNVEEEIKVGNDHVMVEVGAEVCNDCGERFFPQGTVDHLLKLKRKLKKDKKQFKAVGKVFRAA